MSQDIVADVLNKILNAKKAKKDNVVASQYSKLLISLLAIAKLKGYIKQYKVEESVLKIELGNIHGCSAIKPRFTVTVDEIDKYVKRYLPAKDIGIIIISTSKGLMTNYTAKDKGIGGHLIAYLY